MKGTSGAAGRSEENIELLEKMPEKITKEIRTNRQGTPETAAAKEKQEEENGRIIVHNDNYIVYGKGEHEESAGCYKVVNDAKKGYKILAYSRNK